ncbi:retrovirus-related pol polyprotein from transposon TNT 1-94 [Tanacetum coccineum]|uniref:Retrovirus-related pol polyprotein from transposon TNT 1-94 n=1 Tax=Tanacetum coccineum TaxID=301880 RepID=A0ABQ4Z694_9ASTR
MAGLPCNKFRGDKGKIILVLLIRTMLLFQGEIQQVDNQELLNATTAKVKGIWLGNALSQSDQGMLHDPRILADQAQTIILHNAAFQTEDLDTYDSDCNDLSIAQAVLMANISNYGSDIILELAKDGLARGIPRLKFQKDHLCSACALGKSKKSSHQPKAEDTNQEKLYLLHMDLCGPMRVASINGKRYILVIVDDYSRFTWVRFLKTKDEAPAAIIKCIKNIQVRLKATVRNVRTDNGTEFVNQTLREWRNRTLVESTQTMPIFSKAPLFLWTEAINTACYTQNRSLICLRYNKTPYELMQDKKPDLSFFHVFGSLCYPTNDHEDLGKFDAKADIGIFVGYTPAKKAFRIYNRRTWIITKTIQVTFDELTAMASEQFSSGPGLQGMTPATSST